ncbi:MAG: class I SAM-dependent methyltransferase [Candidatus Hydrogenedentes bacterium]|nr:class I SAM-dependent methyltransferase [Candidatus Hydrogenedentota bacterium]
MAYPWQYDESVQIGTDYRDENEVREYDERMRRLRDVAKEAADIAEAIAIEPDSTVWEIGTGTGECALQLSRMCKKVFAADVSHVMLAYARRKAEERRVENVEFELGGFLSGFQPDTQVDAIVSQLALHHLPDFWKSRALENTAQKLRKGGRFYLRDVVFPAQTPDFDAYFEALIAGIRKQGGDDFADKTVRHIKSEFSTLDWILEGMLDRAGLKILRKDFNGFLTAYVCEK